ncbi:MAG: phosphate acyltransferase PlsX [Elusimicrobia bacterium]|nr:phosphate acyltransferase PlsX [Elusimicrobiota bacterium]
MPEIFLDAMGGDFAPEYPVKGAVRAVSKISSNLFLVGNESEIKKILGDFSHPRLKIIHASQKIAMDEKPAIACKKYPDSSIMVAMRKVKETPNSIFISAGNSGAVVAAACMTLERIPGVLRPAISIIAKGIVAPFILVDGGANVSCNWKHLFQFGIFAHACAKEFLGISNPRVALLSNGSEPTKGTEEIIKAHEALKKSSLNFIGNVEGNEVFSGNFDCLICDGFVGNVLLKFAEGFAKTIKNIVSSGKKISFAKIFLKKFAKKLFKKFDYTEYGASFLLGLKGSVMVTHGIADEIAIMNAIISSEKGDGKISDIIAEEINKNKDILEEK